MDTTQLADLLDRAATQIRKTAGNIRNGFDAHLLSAECAKAAYNLRDTPPPDRAVREREAFAHGRRAQYNWSAMGGEHPNRIMDREYPLTEEPTP